MNKNLDLSTLEVVTTSHPCRTVLTPENDQTDFDKLEFFFEGINLPASADDESGSHGFVTFKIKPKNSLSIGNTITNKADIYFDYNFPMPPIWLPQLLRRLVSMISMKLRRISTRIRQKIILRLL